VFCYVFIFILFTKHLSNDSYQKVVLIEFIKPFRNMIVIQL